MNRNRPFRCTKRFLQKKSGSWVGHDIIIPHSQKKKKWGAPSKTRGGLNEICWPSGVLKTFHTRPKPLYLRCFIANQPPSYWIKKQQPRSWRNRVQTATNSVRIRINRSEGGIRTHDQLINSQLRYRCATSECFYCPIL